MTNWKPITETTPSLEPDGIPFVLTRAEKSQAALYALRLEAIRRQRNDADARQARAEALGNAARLGVEYSE